MKCPNCGCLIDATVRKPLTERQREVLHFLTVRIRMDGIAPTFAEIAAAFDFKSMSTVHEHLKNLELKGRIRRAPAQQRGIEIVEAVAA